MTDQNPPFVQALNTVLDTQGRESASALFSTPGGIDQMFIGPNQAIPVVFVPGIMGSPLLATGKNRDMWSGQGKWAWNPDNSLWMARGFARREYYDRRRLLNPADTAALELPDDADPEQLQKLCENNAAMPWEEARRRGWGSVMVSSYGSILLKLQTQLQQIFFYGRPHDDMARIMPEDPSGWGELKGYTRLTEDQLRKAAGWRFPVYAVGYNWLDSNAAAAQYLKRRVDAIREDCRNRLRLKCDQVILVTHSMGGLVARMYAKQNPQDVLGVVHGVQPAIGAATAYARVRGGWDSNTSWLSPLNSVMSMIGAWVLGPTGYEVSAVFAGGAGPLELLPNQYYGNGWLRIQYGQGRQAETLLSLPTADPYEEIYKDKNHWWRLIHPACLVNPDEYKKNPGILTSEWRKYEIQLAKAKSFHTRLGDYYHPETFAHCGADAGQQAWHRVNWQLEPLMEIGTGVWGRKPTALAASQMKLTRDMMKGSCDLQDASTAGDVWTNRNGVGVIAQSQGSFYRAWISGKDDSGDATVPRHSGLAPRPHVRFFAEMHGFEHQASYNDEAVQAVTLYSLVSLAIKAKALA